MSALVVTTSGSGQASASYGADLISQVARIASGESESNVRSQAMDCLNRVVLRINKRDWRFTKRTNANITLVNATATYALETAFKAPSFARLLDRSQSNLPAWDLTYVDDAWFSHQYPTQQRTGRPGVYSLRNSYADGLVTLYPIPGSSEASSWFLQVEYYGRIALIKDDQEPLALIPQELTEVLVLGGQYGLLKERKKESPLVPALRADYERSFQEMLNFDRRNTDAQSRFRLKGASYAQAGTVLIRIN